MSYFSNLKIILKFAMIFSLVLFSVLASYTVVLWFSSKQKSQGSQIDVAGRNRMLSQRIGAMAMLIDSDNEAQASLAKEEMRKALVQMDQSLEVLKNGGIAPGIEGNIELPPAPAIITPKISEVQEFFKGHKEIAGILMNEPRYVNKVSAIPLNDSSTSDAIKIPNAKFNEALGKIIQHLVSGTLLKMNVELTQLFTQQATESKSNFTTVLIGLLVINIAIVAFAFAYLRSTLKPLEAITHHMSTLSSGHLPPLLKLDRGDEIGEMNNALNLLSKNLESATEFAENVGAGKLETEVQVFNGKGDLSASLYAMRDNLKKVTEDDKKRNWSTEGLAKFSDILRSNSDLKTLGDNIISNLVKYTDSNQGSLYILNDSNSNDVYLELLSCYAFNRKKFVEKKILLGEGLAGQSYLERDTILMKQVPDDYISISSGLGEAKPRSILIVPLKVNEDVTGIVEIASFNEYQPHEVSFVERLAENIASTITGVKINERTQRLLQSSQQLAEELKSQEEEMRQNMEELSATQDDMSRKEKEYLEKIQELEQRLNVMTN
jgi:nitrate/nitrite-specific signal transduction histidine kinase